MKKFDDEILMAYVDSELGDDERKEVELFLAEDSQARETVERYRTTRTAIKQFANILDEPVPEHLVNTIHQHQGQSHVAQLPERTNTGRRWMAIAASLVIGVGLGTITMNYLVIQPSENETTITASKMAELSKTIEVLKAEKENAEKNEAIASNNAAEAAKKTTIAENNAAKAEKIIEIAKSKINDLASALEVAQAENKKVQEQILASIPEKSKETLLKEIETVFPYKLVSEAIDNGTTLSADMRKNILSELNTPVATASSFSKLINNSREEDLTTGTSQYETLSDLQPADPVGVKTSEKIETREGALNQPKKVKSIIGEFSYSSKTCRLFEYEIPYSTKTSTLLACHSDAGLWEIIQR